ncbi:MAG TPA: amino acid adenylation domain-containing protein [Nostocaceae cyanobacterium]|nr:amino acid adenylation domain-containing protein [Nostocaceae cyanobacterium]
MSKNVVKFLSQLRQLNIQVFADGDKLRYRADKGVVTPELRQQIAEYKTEILAFLNQVNQAQPSHSSTITTIPRGENLPLSFGQERLWILDQLQGSTAYNEHGGIRITGQLDVAAIKSAFAEVLRRHEVLRTNFPVVNNQPVQAIAPQAKTELKQLDWRDITASIQEDKLRYYAQEHAQMQFDLAADSLVNATLIQLGQQEWVLLIVMHHIICDYWSVNIFIQELGILYQSFSQGQQSPLPELAIQYVDYAHWQRQRIDGELGKLQLDYWKKQLAGAPSVLQLPSDRPRPSVQSHRGEVQIFTLDSVLTAKLQQLSQNLGVTLFMTLLSAFSTLLYRYSNQNDILIGSPIANRNQAEIEPLIGFIANILVLRVQFGENLTFTQLLEQVREMTLQGYAHQDVPFEQVVEALQLERSLSYSPLVQVMFVFQNVPKKPLVLPGVTLQPFTSETQTAKFDLTLMIDESEQGLVGIWKYNTDLFDPETIARMAGHFQTLLTNVVIDPEQPINQLPFLTEAEKYQICQEWNHTQVKYPQDQCIHQLFEQQVQKTPDAIAVRCADQILTYRELNHRANQLAHYLQDLGVQPETLVGMYLERSVEMIVGLLGILKAGGAYVPLDPKYPQERLRYMLNNSQVLVLLTQEKLLDFLPSFSANIISLDTDWQAVISVQSQENPVCQNNINNLAYVIYTSGSTGEPKGVAIEHKSILNYYYSITERLEFKPQSNFALVSTISADLGNTVIFPSLCTGGTLHVLSEQLVFDADGCAAYFQRYAIDYLKIVPSHLAALQASTTQNTLTQNTVLPRQTLILGGEAASTDWVESIQALAPKCTIVNHYGPTEATVGVLTYQLEKNPQNIKCTTLPLGRPLANTQIYILDSYMQPVPIGVPGEIYIGGAGLARGYCQHPELTAQKFIPNPFDDRFSPLLYKTGDLARYLPDGNIQFLGRIDQQVKIRGFRIELEEIATVLTTHPQVKEAIVIDREDTPNHKRLVAYITTDADALASSELFAFLKHQLPEYMIPSSFVILPALPLTPNGKVDRRALPVPELEKVREDEFVAPQTPIEQSLAAIWQEVLNLPQVSINDNFFAIGGDSILSIQVVSRAKQVGIQITPKQLFQYQTVAELARVANTATPLLAQQGIVTGEVPLTPIQKWFFEQNWSEPHHYNQSVMLQVPNTFNPQFLAQAVKHLLKHHDALRLQFINHAGKWQQINHGLEDTVPFEQIDLSPVPQSQQLTALEEIAAARQASFSLSTAPLMRVVLFNLGNGCEGRLLIIIHHLVVDGVSWRILLEDLLSIYQQLKQGERIQLPQKTTAFQDWAMHLSDYAQSNDLQQQLNYWLNLPWSKVAPLPVDQPVNKDDNTVANANEISVELNQQQTDALLKEVSSAYNTQINDVLLTALAQTLRKWTGKANLVIDLEGHGRENLFEEVDLSRTVGWFTTIFPVLLRLENITDSGETLKAVKEQLREIPGHGIGYGILRYLNPDKEICTKLQALPQADIRFNYFGQFTQERFMEVSWQFDAKSRDFERSSQGDRPYLLDVNAMVVEGKLQITWTYCDKIHHNATVSRLAQKYIEELQKLIDHCLSPDIQGYTPSDFPEAGLSQQQLDNLLAELGI